MQNVVLMINLRIAWRSQILIQFFQFLNLLQDANIICKKVLIVLRNCTKHAQFWFDVQFPLKPKQISMKKG